ncbi:hypothetical protein [Marinobacterium aestuariivivens]|uniref:Glycosyltransferase family 1 protein n=1 Tax=Marinobacterium aestuariivivens TaxID=1698799 RepID=A0ABW1ZYZ3_9GAMM
MNDAAGPINLFVSRTPLQLLNCIEARDRFHGTGSTPNVLLLTYRKPADLALCEPLLDGGWNRVIRFRLNAFSRYCYPLLLWRALADSRIDHYYSAWLKHLHAHIFNTWRPARTLLIDDGNEVLIQSSRIEKGELFGMQKASWLDRLLRRRRSIAADVRPAYFTLYELPWVPAGRHILNDYRALREKGGQLERRDLVLFIGSNTHPKHIRDAAVFTGLLRRVRTHFGDRRLLYVLHRYEDAQRVRALAEPLGFEVVRFDSILECVPLAEGWLPQEVATFNSSAADTLHQLYGLPVTVFEIALDRLGPDSNRDKWQQLYRELAARHPNFICDNGQALP